MKKLVSAVYGAIIAISVTLFYEFLSKTLTWPQFASMLGAINLGAIFLIIYEFVSNSPFIKRRFSAIARVEGEWEISVVDWVRPSSIALIRMTSKEYIYKGYGISQDGRLAAEWTSRHIHYDDEKEELSFTADGLALETGKRFRNYGYIKFHKNAAGEYDHGTGYFVDMTDEIRQAHMILRRISAEEFDKKMAEIQEAVSTAYNKSIQATAKAAAD